MLRGRAVYRPASAPRAPPPPRRPRRPLPVYPSFAQTVKWNPFVETACIPAAAPEPCRCSVCTARRRREPPPPPPPARALLSSALECCERATNTLTVSDASCGICLGVEAPAPVTSVEVWAVASHSSLSVRRAPIADDRFGARWDPADDCAACWPPTFDACNARPVRDPGPGPCPRPPDDARAAPAPPPYERQPAPLPTFPASDGPKRRTLYNEGISDAIANRLPPPTGPLRQRVPGVQQPKQPPPRSPPEPVGYIPHAHRGVSRYHASCRGGPGAAYVADAEGRWCSEAPGEARWQHGACGACGGLRRPYSAPPPAPRPAPPPKRLITSEKDFDAFTLPCRDKCAEDEPDTYEY